jgi:hypothetical protein
MYLKADDGPIPVLEWDNQSIESVLTGEGDTRAQTVFVSISFAFFLRSLLFYKCYKLPVDLIFFI